MSDYLLKVKVQNNRIIALMKQRGIDSVSELARQSKIGQGLLGDLINMTASPLQSHTALGKNGTSFQGDGLWRKCVLQLADFFGVLPDEMFNYQQLNEPLKDNKAERAIELEQLIALMGNKEIPLLEDARFDDEKQKILDDVLQTLTPKEQKVLIKRFGLEDGNPGTLDETRAMFDVSRERIRQMEAKALRKLRQPIRANKLKEMQEETIQKDEYDYNVNVTFCLNDEQKERLRKAYHNCAYRWRDASYIQDIHKASAAKYIDQYNNELTNRQRG